MAFIAHSEHALKHWQASIQIVIYSDFLLAINIPVNPASILRQRSLSSDG